ncbi:hypothetical protein EJ07DRAFT_176776 [Lizonia empirigonia]|nr:hypothetical protein EJ07DRAFT_176776 [Lizonia empirigonia]
MSDYISRYSEFETSQLETICRMRNLPKDSWIEMVMNLAAQDREFEQEQSASKQDGQSKEVGELADEVAAVSLDVGPKEVLKQQESEPHGEEIMVAEITKEKPEWWYQ